MRIFLPKLLSSMDAKLGKGLLNLVLRTFWWSTSRMIWDLSNGQKYGFIIIFENCYWKCKSELPHKDSIGITVFYKAWSNWNFIFNIFTLILCKPFRSWFQTLECFLHGITLKMSLGLICPLLIKVN